MAYRRGKKSSDELEFYELLGDRIKMFRMAKKMTLVDLSVQLGTTCVTHLSKYESGNVCPTIYRLKQIAEALDIDIIQLIPDL